MGAVIRKLQRLCENTKRRANAFAMCNLELPVSLEQVGLETKQHTPIEIAGVIARAFRSPADKKRRRGIRSDLPDLGCLREKVGDSFDELEECRILDLNVVVSLHV